MIDWEKFNNAFKYYGDDLKFEIIQLFEHGNLEDNDPSYEDRITSITEAIRTKDFAGLKFHAHSIKGVVANFYDKEPYEIAALLEKMGAQKTPESIHPDDASELEAKLQKMGIENTEEGQLIVLDMLKDSAQKLLQQLREYRKTLKV